MKQAKDSGLQTADPRVRRQQTADLNSRRRQTARIGQRKIRQQTSRQVDTTVGSGSKEAERKSSINFGRNVAFSYGLICYIRQSIPQHMNRPFAHPRDRSPQRFAKVCKLWLQNLRAPCGVPFGVLSAPSCKHRVPFLLRCKIPATCKYLLWII
jgi:hypothetical protein